MKVDSILFDLDGTIWDATYAMADFFVERLKELNYEVEIPQPLIQSVMGLRGYEIAEVYFRDFPADQRQAMMAELNKGKTEYMSKFGGILYPEVEETLKALSQKYKLFMVSNSSEPYLRSFYDAHQLEKYFTDFESPSRTGLSKGDNIKILVERHQLKAPVYVGDIDKDRIASDFAGVPFIHAAYGFGDATNYIAKIDSFAELLPVVDALEL